MRYKFAGAVAGTEVVGTEAAGVEEAGVSALDFLRAA
jgi:hypothetical protein